MSSSPCSDRAEMVLLVGSMLQVKQRTCSEISWLQKSTTHQGLAVDRHTPQ